MKPFVTFLFCCLVVLSAGVPPTYAHTLKVDGTIGVTLHVDPDDAPVAGVESKFFVDITDKTGRFNPNNPGNCNCILTIAQKGTPLKTVPVVSGGSFTQIRYTFPASGTYTITIEGKPQGEGTPFQEFHTTFETYASEGNAAGTTSSVSGNELMNFLPFIVGAVGVVVVLLFIL